jgi:hypothetical protein
MSAEGFGMKKMHLVIYDINRVLFKCLIKRSAYFLFTLLKLISLALFSETIQLVIIIYIFAIILNGYVSYFNVVTSARMFEFDVELSNSRKFP